MIDDMIVKKTCIKGNKIIFWRTMSGVLPTLAPTGPLIGVTGNLCFVCAQILETELYFLQSCKVTCYKLGIKAPIVILCRNRQGESRRRISWEKEENELLHTTLASMLVTQGFFEESHNW